MNESLYSPLRAALLALIPGMGAAYNRQYDKAVAHFGMFAALCIVAEEGHEIFGMAAAAFYIFNILDAYRSARFLNESGRSAQNPASTGMHLPLWGGLLVLLGTMFFLDNVGLIKISSIIAFSWPLLFVGAGLYLIFRYFFPSSQQPPSAAAPEWSRPAAGQQPLPPSHGDPPGGSGPVEESGRQA